MRIFLKTYRPMELNIGPEINLHVYSQIRPLNGRKDRLFNKWCWENRISACQRMRSYLPLLMPHSKTNSKGIHDLNIRPKTVKKKLEENIGQNFHDVGFGNEFLDITPKVQATKEKNRQIRLHKN